MALRSLPIDTPRSCQAVRQRIGAATVAANMPRIGLANQACILVLLWQIISDVFKQSSSVTTSLLATTVVLVTTLHYAFFGVAWWLGTARRLAAPDQIAFVFSATTKTVVLGVPMLRVWLLRHCFRPVLMNLSTSWLPSRVL